MVIEEETGFHFRRRDDRLVVAMTDPEPRWTYDATVDESFFDDRLERLVRRYSPAAGATIDDAWAGLYDMTPDAHPIVGSSRTVSTRRAGSAATASCSRRPSDVRWRSSSSAASRQST